MKRSIKSKLFLSFSFVLGLAFIIQIVGFITIKRFIQNQTINLLQKEAASASRDIENFFARIELDHQGIASEYVDNEGAIYPSIHNHASFIIKQNRFYKTFSILSPTGRELYKHTRNAQIPEDKLSFEIPTDAFNLGLNGGTGVSKVYFSENSATPNIDIFSPITTNTGDVIGVIKSQLELAQLWEVISEVERGEDGFAYIVDDEGRLLAHPIQEYVDEGKSFTSHPVVAKLLREETFDKSPSDYVHTDDNKVEFVENGLTVPQLGWAIIVQQPTKEAFAEISLLERIFYPTLVITLTLLAIVSLVLSSSVTRPIASLRSLAKRVEDGDLSVKADISTGDEIQELAESFNEMTYGLLQSKQELQQEKEHITAERNKLEVIIAGIDDAVVALGDDMRILLFNPKAENLTGYTARDVIDKPISKFIKIMDGDVEIPVQQYCPKHAENFEGVVFSKQNIFLLGKEGKKVPINLMSSQIREAESVDLGCILTIHDLSKEKELEDMKLDFVSLAAHELRTPLTAITGYLSVFMSENETLLNGDQKTLIGRANIASQQLTGLVENLLNVSQIERGSVTLQLTQMQWTDIVRNATIDLQSRAKDKNIILTFIEPTTRLPLVYVDKLRITEVINNLIANAINYTEIGGKVTVWLESKNNEVITYVQDTGVGIPKEALPNLFTKFFRVSGVLEHGSKGTGLGLYISRSIIEMHHGKIWVDSELGKGSTFMFSLPTTLYDQGSSH